MDIHQVVADNIKAFRKKRNISQEELSQIIGVDRTFIGKIERGDRNITAETLARIAYGLKTVPHTLLVPNYLDSRVGEMEVDLSSLIESTQNNPSLMSFIIGYHAEYMAKREISRQLNIPIEKMRKPDDHDREEHGDIIFPYKGKEYSVEVKSLQTRYVKREPDGTWSAKFQCDGSDATDTTVPDGRTFHTVAYPFGMFDFVAINLFEFGKEWRFAFAHERDLEPMPTNSRVRKDGIPNDARKYFIKTLQDIKYPLDSQYTESLLDLL